MATRAASARALRSSADADERKSRAEAAVASATAAARAAAQANTSEASHDTLLPHEAFETELMVGRGGRLKFKLTHISDVEMDDDDDDDSSLDESDAALFERQRSPRGYVRVATHEQQTSVCCLKKPFHSFQVAFEWFVIFFICRTPSVFKLPQMRRWLLHTSLTWTVLKTQPNAGRLRGMPLRHRVVLLLVSFRCFSRSTRYVVHPCALRRLGKERALAALQRVQEKQTEHTKALFALIDQLEVRATQKHVAGP